MGEVYRARDTRLHRDAGLKVLPDAFTVDSDRLARFRREAQLLASLNHPNIAAIYGFEEAQSDAGTIHALAMELVDGDTLICPQPLPTALDYAKQISEALEYAHEHGVIHRDLKPANIKVTADGVVKVLDFGLAKAIDERAGLVADLTNSPTLSLSATTAGVIIGTAGYMSPEQASGKAADRRADIWSFGTVLYELLTGRRAFAGESVSDTLASVLKVEPDWSHLPADTPSAIRRLLQRCLTKDRRQRLQAIGDARLDIEDAQRAPSREAVTPSRQRVSPPALFASILVALIVGAAAMFVSRPAPPVPQETRLDVVTPPTSQPWSFALSPDGQQLAFVATSDSGSQLWVRSLASATARPLPRTEGAVTPFWSPDGRSIAFFSDQKLKRIDLEGGAVQVIADAIVSLGGTWNADDVILFSRMAGEPILRVSARGGMLAPVTRLEPNNFLNSSPRFLPDGRHFLFYARPRATGGVYLGTLDNLNARRLVDADSGGELSPSGELLFVRQGTLFAATLDVNEGRLTSTPTPVAEGVFVRDPDGAPVFSVARSGAIAYRPSSTGGGRQQFVWFDRTGQRIENVGDPDSALVWSPSLSPDESRAVLWRVAGSQPSQVFILDLKRGLLNRFSYGGGLFGTPVWSPDGGRIIFSNFLNGFYEQSVNAASAEPRLLLKGGGMPTDLSADGRIVLFTSGNMNDTDVMAFRLGGGDTVTPIVKATSSEGNAKFSPDHRWITYRSYKTGRSEVFIQAFPGPGADVQVSISGGAQPRWSRDGKEIFYIGLDGKLMAAPVQVAADGTRATIGQPAALFASHVSDPTNVNGQQYDVSRDGKRFFILTVTEDGGSPIVVISNRRGTTKSSIISAHAAPSASVALDISGCLGSVHRGQSQNNETRVRPFRALSATRRDMLAQSLGNRLEPNGHIPRMSGHNENLGADSKDRSRWVVPGSTKRCARNLSPSDKTWTTRGAHPPQQGNSAGNSSDPFESCRTKMSSMRYAIVIEKGADSYGAYVPDLPGVVSVGDTEEEVTANIREAVMLHLEGLREAGDEIPKPRTSVAVIEAA